MDEDDVDDLIAEVSVLKIKLHFLVILNGEYSDNLIQNKSF